MPSVEMMEMAFDEDEVESVFIPTSKDAAATVNEGDVITVVIKGKVMGAIAREGDAAEFDTPGTVRVAVSSVMVDGKDEMEDFIADMVKDREL